jgi:ribonucleoside-diphosphate reductase alpha subunit
MSLIKQVNKLIEYPTPIVGLDLSFLSTKNHTSLTLATELGHRVNYSYQILAGRILIDSLFQTTPKTIIEYVNRLSHRLCPKIANFLLSHASHLEEIISSSLDLIYDHDFFSACSLIKTYLARPSSKEDICESIPHFWMRIAVAHYFDSENALKKIRSVYLNLISQRYTPASPTLFNAGFRNAQMASCFLVPIDDNLESILYRGVGDQGVILKNNGGIGLEVSRLRHSEIGQFGSSSGITPWIYLYDAVARAVNQGGKRPGASTIVCTPWHVDVIEFIEETLKNGDHYQRAHNINTSFWIPDLFWERAKNDEDWTLFCPNKAKRLNDGYGPNWEQIYREYEADESIPKKTIKARKLLSLIVSIQRQSGMPYIMHRDSVNRKSNQKNVGYIRQTNLCQEIVEYTDENEIAVCNLSSISLRSIVIPGRKLRTEEDILTCINWKQLQETVKEVVENLNEVIFKNFYPLEACRRSNMRHRPIGIGVSGFAEMVYEIDAIWEDETNPKKVHPLLRKLNKTIFACIYFSALVSSVNLTKKFGVYETFSGSPASLGKLQFDLWREEYLELRKNGRLDERIRKEEDDIPIEPKEWGGNCLEICFEKNFCPSTWEELKSLICQFGLTNSQLIALMPTATSAQPLRNSESVEAPQTNIYSRKLMNNAYIVLNRYLQKDLEEIGLWNSDVADLIQLNSGSINDVYEFVKTNSSEENFDRKGKIKLRFDHLIRKYRTMFELSPKIFLQMAADRGRYVCQSQSTNIYISDPSDAQLIALHLTTWSLGLKTGMYYLRQSPAMEAVKATLSNSVFSFAKRKQNSKKKIICSDEVCLSCQ